MKARRRHKSKTAPRPQFVWVTLLVICALLSHSLDNCAAHLGVLGRVAAAPQVVNPCPNGSGLCEVCAPTDTPHQDGCDLLSETAVLNSSQQHPLEHQAATLAATVAVLPAMPQVIALSGSLHGRAGPPPALPASVYLRSSLPSRAPPISA